MATTSLNIKATDLVRNSRLLIREWHDIFVVYGELIITCGGFLLLVCVSLAFRQSNPA